MSWNVASPDVLAAREDFELATGTTQRTNYFKNSTRPKDDSIKTFEDYEAINGNMSDRTQGKEVKEGVYGNVTYIASKYNIFKKFVRKYDSDHAQEAERIFLKDISSKNKTFACSKKPPNNTEFPLTVEEIKKQTPEYEYFDDDSTIQDTIKNITKNIDEEYYEELLNERGEPEIRSRQLSEAIRRGRKRPHKTRQRIFYNEYIDFNQTGNILERQPTTVETLFEDEEQVNEEHDYSEEDPTHQPEVITKRKMTTRIFYNKNTDITQSPISQILEHQPTSVETTHQVEEQVNEEYDYSEEGPTDQPEVITKRKMTRVDDDTKTILEFPDNGFRLTIQLNKVKKEGLENTEVKEENEEKNENEKLNENFENGEKEEIISDAS